jgi:hypothetical protein
VLGRGAGCRTLCPVRGPNSHLEDLGNFYSPASGAGKTSTPEGAAPTFENLTAQHAEKALTDLRKTDGAKALAEQLCIECRENPGAGGGQLTRCIACIKAAADVDRQYREALQAKAKARLLCSRSNRPRRAAPRLQMISRIPEKVATDGPASHIDNPKDR